MAEQQCVRVVVCKKAMSHLCHIHLVQQNAIRQISGPGSGGVIDQLRVDRLLRWSDPRGGSGYGPSYRKSRGVFMFGPDAARTQNGQL